MNFYGAPALVSGLLNLILALIAWLHRRRERLNISLALFTTGLALLSLGRFVVFLCETEEQVRSVYRFPQLVYPLVIGSAVYYALVLSGYIGRLSERVLGIPLRIYVLVTVVYLVVEEVLLQAVPPVIKRVQWTPRASGYDVEVGAAISYTQWVVIPLLAVFFYILIKALREAEAGPYKRFLTLNAVGIVFMFVSAPLVVLALAPFGIDGRPFIFIGSTISCAVFYFALIHYQFDQVQQLNLGLERKVEERTRHLQEAQARLVQSEKMASLGHLVAGVAHEFNTPIGAVRSTNSTLQRRLDRLDDLIRNQVPESEALLKAVDRMRDGHQVVDEGAKRVADIVQRLKAFARLDQADLQITDLHQSIEDTLGVLLPEQGEIEVVRSFGDLPRVACFPAQVNQMLQNLLINAMEAMQGKGEIEVKTFCEGKHAVVSIRDSGPGIPDEALSRIFDPGFTTKSRGIGTGLGLAICYQIMQEHHGSIAVESKKDAGTTISLLFPLQLDQLLRADGPTKLD